MLYALLLSVASLLALSLPFLHVSTCELSIVTFQHAEEFQVTGGYSLDGFVGMMI